MREFENIGNNYITDNWKNLHPKTREFLEKNGYELNSREVSDRLSIDCETLLYAVGLFREAAGADLPENNRYEVKSFILDNELIIQASNLLSSHNEYHSSDFARIAIHALMKRQVIIEHMKLVDKGVSITPSVARIGIKLAFIIFSCLAFPIAMAHGLISVMESDEFQASAWFLVAMFVGTGLYKRLGNEDLVSLPYKKWHTLFIEDSPFFHIGIGRGLQVKLENMVNNGIYVPSLLFDLCNLLKIDNVNGQGNR